MLTVREVILVEGRYDKNTISQVVDATIFETSGFGIFNDNAKKIMFQEMAHKNGVIIFTDSDSAGLVIRNYLKNILPKDKIKHAYIPDIKGKEKRKRKDSKEGKLGVEGMPPQIIIECLRRAGATFENESTASKLNNISKNDFYLWGLTGKPYSAQLRKQLLNALKLPENLSANSMIEAINMIVNKPEFEELVKQAREELRHD